MMRIKTRRRRREKEEEKKEGREENSVSHMTLMLLVDNLANTK